MGRMVDGNWLTDEALAAKPSDEWRREESILRDWVTADGLPRTTGAKGFKAEPARYHLYAAWNCPWAHRALLTRAIKGLQDHVDVSYVAPARTDQGWVFSAEFADTLYGKSALHEIYQIGTQSYAGRVTVPVLFDTHSEQIVSNESADIVRMLGAAFDHLGADAIDLYPAELRDDIDRWNDRIYRNLNNGVYRAGFSSTQAAYDEAVCAVFEMLDAIERQLSEHMYLCGERFTEADIRLFPTLARFDVAYFSAFKCNIRRLTDYPKLWNYARRIYTMPGIANTVDFEIYRTGYHSKNDNRNPFGIVPIGPSVGWQKFTSRLVDSYPTGFNLQK